MKTGQTPEEGSAGVLADQGEPVVVNLGTGSRQRDGRFHFTISPPGSAEVVRDHAARHVDPVHLPESGDPIPPFGLLATILFVRMVAALCFFVTMGVVLATLVHLIKGPFSDWDVLERLVESLMLVTGSVISYMMLAGGAWLDSILSQRCSSCGTKRIADPARGFFLPVLLGLAIYGGLAILLWIPSLSEMGFATSWPLPLVWGIIGGVALIFHGYFDSKLAR